MVARSTNSPRFPEIQLAARQYGMKDGVPSITFTAAEFQAASQRFAHTLVAKFQIGRPPFEIVKRTMLAAWNIEGRITISSNWDDRHIVIILDSDKDVNSVLTSPLRKIGHTMFRVFRWTPDYNPKKESTTVTKWIRFPGLPMEMFDRAFLRSIVSSFALFLDIDAKTKEMDSLSFARACVEINVSNPVPSRVWINLPDNKGFFQDIVIEGGLQYCAKCKIHGHDLTSCRKVSRNAEIKDVTDLKHTDKGSNLSKVQDNSGQPTKPEQEWRIVESRNNKEIHKGLEFPLKEDSTNHDEKDTVNEIKSPQDVDEANNSESPPVQIHDNDSMEGWTKVKPKRNNSKVKSASIPKEQRDNEVEDKATEPLDHGAILQSGNNEKGNNKIVDIPHNGNNENEAVNIQKDGVIVGNASTEKLNEVMKSSELQIPEGIAQKLSSYDGWLIDCEDIGVVDARGFYMHLMTGGEDEKVIFEELDDLVKGAGHVEQEGSGIPIEESDKGLTDHKVIHNNDNEICDQVTSLRPSLQKSRPRKKKGSRSSTRSCPKQKDSTFVWS